MGDLPSLHSATGLSVTIQSPVVWTTRQTLADIAETLSGYEHVIRSVGGFYSATIRHYIGLEEINAWIQDGLGRHVEVRGPGLGVAWEGFVDSIDIMAGRAKLTIGPLSDIGNYVKGVYSTIDTTTNRVGARASTAWVSVSQSIARYGRWEKVISIAGTTAANATQIVNSWLQEHAWPESGRRGSLQGGSRGELVLNCLGYWAWTEAYLYANAATGTQNLSAKIAAILAADPNGVMSTDYTGIATNTTAVLSFEDRDRTAWTLLKSLAAQGNAAFYRYTLGFYENRRCVYALAPMTIGLQTAITENAGYTNLAQQTVLPWAVRPNEWAFFGDLLIGSGIPASRADLNADIRAGFIEQVKFTAPYDLEVDGQKVSSLDQQLARLGLAGAGV